MARLALSAALLCLVWSAPARAQFGARARVAPPVPSGAPVDPTASATVVEVARDPRPFPSLDEVLLEVPGARPRRTGTLGALATLSLRGADSDHTTVLLGDVPIGPADGGAFDLSTVPPSLLERVEVFRGGAPVWLGATGIGGVLRLVPREARGRRAELSLGGGSFGTAQGHAAVSLVEPSALSWNAVVHAAHTEGDYAFLDDRGTALDTGDDVEAVRRNAQTTESSALLQLRAPLLDGTVDAVFVGFERTGGVPGPAQRQTRDVHRLQLRATGALAYTYEGNATNDRKWKLSVVAGFTLEQNRVTDTLGELGQGVPRATDDRTLRPSLRVATEQPLSSELTLAAVATYAAELFTPSDALAARPNGASARHLLGAALEARVEGRGELRWEARLSGRLDASLAELVEIRPESLGTQTNATQLAPTVRLSGVLEPVHGLALSASIATATRLPTILELFGDRGFLQGDTRLRPERSWAFDASAVWRGREGILRGSAELRGFALLVDDLIAYVRTAQFTATPRNLQSGVIGGMELGARGELGDVLALRLALTVLDARGDAGRTLPLRPPVQLYARTEVRVVDSTEAELVLFVDVAHTASSFVDAANLTLVPERTPVGTGLVARFFSRALELDAAVRDVFDVRGTDVLGFPLPGRSVAVSLTGRTDAL